MTTVETERRAPKLLSRTSVALIVLALVAVGWLGYFAHYGQCDFRSKFCIVAIAGTRSEFGVEWETPSIYVSTWPNG